MASHVCRSCGTALPADAATCPECGAADPVVPGAAGTTGPAVADRSPAATPPGGTTGSRIKSAAKAIGCLVIAVIVLLIAVALGFLDFLF